MSLDRINQIYLNLLFWLYDYIKNLHLGKGDSIENAERKRVFCFKARQNWR